MNIKTDKKSAFINKKKYKGLLVMSIFAKWAIPYIEKRDELQRMQNNLCYKGIDSARRIKSSYGTICMQNFGNYVGK